MTDIPVNLPSEYGVSEILKAADAAVVVEASALKMGDLFKGKSGWAQYLLILPQAMNLLVHAAPSVGVLASLNLPEFEKECLALDVNEATVVANEVAADMNAEGQPGADVVQALITKVTATYNLVQDWILSVKKWFHLA